MASSNRHRLGVLVVFLLILNIVNAQKNETKELVRDDFSIEYPSYLEVDESGEEGSILILKTQKAHPDDIFIENINLTTQPIDIEFNLFAEDTEKRIRSIATITESKRLKVNGRDCLRLIFQLSQNNVTLIFIQHFFIANQKVYALTFSSEAKEFNNYYDEMNEVLMSFNLL